MILSYGLFGVFACIALILNVGADLRGAVADRGDADPAGDRGDRADHRHGGRRQRAGVRAHPRGTENRRGRRAPSSWATKGRSAIVDANITTFIIAVILFAMGSGPVRGFAVTLGIGILTSVFTAIFVTRLLIVTWFERRRPKRSRSERDAPDLVPQETKWDFFAGGPPTLRRVGGADGGLGRPVLVMGLNFGIDFLGGTTIRTEARSPSMSAPIATRWRRWTWATCRSPRSSTRPSAPTRTSR
jgi:SecD/SecF fusion protein